MDGCWMLDVFLRVSLRLTVKEVGARLMVSNSKYAFTQEIYSPPASSPKILFCVNLAVQISSDVFDLTCDGIGNLTYSII